MSGRQASGPLATSGARALLGRWTLSLAASLLVHGLLVVALAVLPALGAFRAPQVSSVAAGPVPTRADLPLTLFKTSLRRGPRAASPQGSAVPPGPSAPLGAAPSAGERTQDPPTPRAEARDATPTPVATSPRPEPDTHAHGHADAYADAGTDTAMDAGAATAAPEPPDGPPTSPSLGARTPADARTGAPDGDNAGPGDAAAARSEGIGAAHPGAPTAPPDAASAVHALLAAAARGCAPSLPRSLRQAGTVEVAFCVDQHGRAAGLRVLRSSGSPLLDAAASTCVLPRAEPFPPIALGGCFSVPVRFGTGSQ